MLDGRTAPQRALSPLLLELQSLFGLCVPENMQLACEGVDEPEAALHQMSHASLETLLRELRRDSDSYRHELGRVDEAYTRVSEALDEYFRLSDLDNPQNEASLRSIQDQLLATNGRQRREVCIGSIVDSDWWREVTR